MTAEDLRDLFVLQTLDVVEHDHRPVSDGQAGERPFHARAQHRVAVRWFGADLGLDIVVGLRLRCVARRLRWDSAALTASR